MTAFSSKNLFCIIPFVLSLFSCNPYEKGSEIEPEGAIPTKEVEIDYESAELLAKFDTKALGLPEIVSYREEINKVQDYSEDVHYSGLDSMFSNGTDVNEVFTDKYSGNSGIDLRFSLKEGFSNASKYTSTSVYESNAMDRALDLYALKKTEKCFDMVHFLLARGFNSNEGGTAALYRFLRASSKGYFVNEERVHATVQLFKFYGFDMKNIDLSASDSNEKLLEYLIDQGSVTYNMNTFTFEDELRKIYRQKDSLIAKGVTFNFADIDGTAFTSESDTASLLMMLEMGLSPYHKTPAGRNLRSDFRAFSNTGLKAVLDQYRLDHPERQ